MHSDFSLNKLYLVLFLSTQGTANSFLVRFAGRPDSKQQPDRQAAWKAMDEKYLNSSVQRRRVLTRKLKGMMMRPTQDFNKYITEVFQQRDDHILDIILEDLSDEYEPSDLPPRGTLGSG